jgi:hypothetical protein
MAKNEMNNIGNDMVSMQMMKEFRAMMNTPLMKKARLQAEKLIAESQAKLDFEKGLEAVHKDAISRFVGGKPSDRGVKVLRVIDGNLIRVSTDERSICKNIEAIKTFEELDTMERSFLYENHKTLYKKLQMDAYAPVIDDKLINLLALEGECMLEYFDIEISNPLKPSLEKMPLGSATASEVLDNYNKQKSDYETAKANYLKDMEAYTNGEMHKNLRECQDRIDTLEKEIRGEI